MARFSFLFCHSCSTLETKKKSFIFLTILAIFHIAALVAVSWGTSNGDDVGTEGSYVSLGKRNTVQQVLRPCSQEYRRNVIRTVCPLFDQHTNNATGDKLLQVVAIDHSHRLLYCGLPKSGSRAWLTYLVNISHSRPANRWKIRDRTFMSSVGIEYRKKVPVKEVLTKYQNYTKFTVVRHPLQWFVALYYEAIFRLRKYTEEDGSTLTLGSFIDGLPTYRLYQKSWSSYELFCHHCLINYDYILKAETIDVDGRMLAEVIGTDIQPPFIHLNDNFTKRHQNFKYDDTFYQLKSERSHAVHHLLAYYQKEMKMFGYQWNDTSGSACHNEDHGDVCC